MTGLIAILTLLPLPALAQGMPAGATSLSETYGDWQIACAVNDAVPACTLSQAQFSNDSRRQRVLAIELNAADQNGAVSGTLALPFGLKLGEGVQFAVDEQELLRSGFSTCLPVGCLVPLMFDPGAVTQLKSGKSLAVTAKVLDSQQEAAFSISLTGLSAALDRLAQVRGN